MLSAEGLQEEHDRLLDESLRENKFLAGLIGQYGLEEVRAASLEVLGCPAEWVLTNKEAIEVSHYLSSIHKE